MVGAGHRDDWGMLAWSQVYDLVILHGGILTFRWALSIEGPATYLHGDSGQSGTPSESSGPLGYDMEMGSWAGNSGGMVSVPEMGSTAPSALRIVVNALCIMSLMQAQA